jgi:hypothetical protein
LTSANSVLFERKLIEKQLGKESTEYKVPTASIKLMREITDNKIK